jgi:uncharacterized protein (TIGR02588 family)
MAEKRSGKALAPFVERTPILEWITAAIGLVLALGAVAFLTWEGLHASDRSPVLVSRVQAITPTPQGYVVDIEIQNESRATASAVQVEGLLPSGSGPEEEVTLTFDYVPARGRREGSMTFRRDPRGQPLTVEVKGQVAP